MIRKIAIAATLLWAINCTKQYQCLIKTDTRPHSLPSIGCKDDYLALSSEREDAIFARTKTINWLIDRENHNRLYFINTKDWELHYLFAAAFLDDSKRSPVGTHAEFNQTAYYGQKRRFVLGKLVRYEDQNKLTFEMGTGDDASEDMIVSAFNIVRAALYNGRELRYRPVSAIQEATSGSLSKRIPVIQTETVFRGQKYQPLHQRTGFGTLRFIRIDQLAQANPSPTDIVVLDRVPNDISLVSGIITDEFQTPLAHINILSKNRGTPNMALRGAFHNQKLRALEGKLVRLEVSRQQYRVRATTLALAKRYWKTLRPTVPLVPQYSLAETGIVDLHKVGADAVSMIGAKAANLAELYRIKGPKLPLPEASFALPFSAYNNHLVRHGINKDIKTMLRDAGAQKLTHTQRSERLFSIRWKIYRSPLASAFRDTVKAAIQARWGTKRIRFRSSTNVEDLPEFSGAGLYTSAGASLAQNDQTIENAIKVVWASAWNEQAFVEREFYRVDQRKVFMGVLVHPAFQNELANGVVITANTYTHRRPGLYINSQVGEVSVTNPTGQATSEQILYYTWYENPEYEEITRSSLLPKPDWPSGTSVLTRKELDKLAGYADQIHKHFEYRLGGGKGFAMDIEYKLAKDRVLYIKQARPLKQR